MKPFDTLDILAIAVVNLWFFLAIIAAIICYREMRPGKEEPEDKQTDARDWQQWGANGKEHTKRHYTPWTAMIAIAILVAGILVWALFYS